MTYTVLLRYDKICRHGFNFFKVSSYSAHVWFFIRCISYRYTRISSKQRTREKNSRGIATENCIISLKQMPKRWAKSIVIIHLYHINYPPPSDLPASQYTIFEASYYLNIIHSSYVLNLRHFTKR